MSWNWLIPWTIGVITWIVGLALSNYTIWGIGIGILIGFTIMEMLNLLDASSKEEVK